MARTWRRPTAQPPQHSPRTVPVEVLRPVPGRRNAAGPVPAAGKRRMSLTGWRGDRPDRHIHIFRDDMRTLNANEAEGYMPAWRTPEGDQSGEIGRYHGHALLRGPRDGDRRVYIVDPQRWGCFIRAQCEGDQELRIDISNISAERARELLDQNPSHFPSEPEEESKLRKLQTLVEIEVGARHGFQVRDTSRARRIIHLGQEPVSQEPES